jgi:Na+-transporting NADH:ubiquinone oxidoreductase subunit C
MPTLEGGGREVATESIKRTIIVALGICFVCSVLVSTAAVSLQSRQEENKRMDRIKNILIAGGLPVEDADLKALYDDTIESRMIDLSTGASISESDLSGKVSIQNFDIRAMAGDPEYGKAIPKEKDIAGIKRMPKYMVVYLAMQGGSMEKIILPVYGKGLWSTLYGFIALDKDLKTVRGITFYEHAETPGLGGEIDNPRWKNIWKGKQAFDDKGNLRIEVIKGIVDTSRQAARYQIDGLSGATRTTHGVNALVRFWLGSDGYGPFLKKLVEELHGQV